MIAAANFEQLPQDWIEKISAWSESEPLILEAHVFGSRARGQAQASSDIDVALLIHESDDPDEKDFNWLVNGGRWQSRLSELLPVKVDLQMIGADDSVVRPAVADHGVLVFRRREEQ